jgi:hypothetical protein
VKNPMKVRLSLVRLIECIPLIQISFTPLPAIR